jgi:2-polyprenyl-3-methyl-5-hydroxy-6-metoxy-1,4-benzoquinol methylase
MPHQSNELNRRIVTSPFGYKVYDPLPTQKDLDNFYKNEYFQNLPNTSSHQIEYSPMENLHRDLKIKLLSEVINKNLSNFSHSSREPRKFLDVGCGEGYHLNYFKKIGWDVLGLDFSTHGLHMNNPNVEKFVLQGDINESLNNLIIDNSEFDVIFLGNVLEHVLFPEKILGLLYKVLKANGLLCITVPNDFSELQKFLLSTGKVDSEYFLTFPDHLNYFNLQNLSKFLDDINLPVIDHYSDFPIEFFLANSHSNYVVDKSKGKEAHLARITLETMINESENTDSKINFWRALSSLGMGRAFTTISKRL